MGDTLKEQLGIAKDYFSGAPIEPTPTGLEEIRPASAGSAAALVPGEAMSLEGRTRLFPRPDSPLCQSGMPSELT